jgi:hemolysin activation/secretion protein
MNALRGAVLGHLLAAVVLVPVCVAPVAAAEATTTAAEPMAFAVRGYKVLGNTLLPDAVVAAATAAYVNPAATFEVVQLALEALERAYMTAGYGSVRVELPEQELDAGVVTLQVVEGVLGEVSVEPDEHFDPANLRHSLPSLVPGQTVNIHALNRNLMLANDGGVKVTNVTFKRSDNQRDVDAVVKVASDSPSRWLLLVDNTGTATTGRFRTGLVYQNANLFNRDHALTVQAQTSPNHVDDVQVLGLSYRVPLYSLGDTLDFNASYSSVDSGRVSNAGGGPDLSISGSGKVFGLRYTRNLATTEPFRSALSLGLERRAYGNAVTSSASAGSLVPDVTTQPLTLGYSANWHSDARDVSAQITWLRNLPGGEHGQAADFDASRLGASATYQIWKFDLQHTERLPSQWSLHSALTLQTTSDLLVPAEQFGVGGVASVRGFSEREVAGDRGLRAGLEVWAPPINLDPGRLLPLAFIEGARVVRNQPAAGEVAGQTISSAGFGLRAAYSRSLSLRLDWGYVLHGTSGSNGTASSNQAIHASVAWIF